MKSIENQSARGSNLLGVGQYNERLILQVIRRAGRLSKAEIARITGLSAQTVSVIINRLLAGKLLHKQLGARIPGRVGQPAVPIALNPNGAFSIGVKIGRSSLDVLLVNFVGEVLQRSSQHYAYPDPQNVFTMIDAEIAALIDSMTSARRKRIVGIGVAAPYTLGGWQQLVDGPEEHLKAWDRIDIRECISRNQSLPVWFANDATAACIAESEFGNPLPWNDFLYVFVGTFIGGGVVQNGVLSAGANGNAGAIGSMPVPAVYSGEPTADGSASVQLIYCASRYLLMEHLKQAGFDANLIIEETSAGRDGQLPELAAGIINEWLSRAADAIAYTIVAAVSVLDFRGVVIDGLLPEIVIERLVAAVEVSLAAQDLEGISRPEIRAGALGNDARALGGAVLPFYNSFTPDLNILLNMGLR